MQRDGALESLWQPGIDTYQTKNSINTADVYDVIIAGGGITGITTALLLQQAGKHCAVIEAYNICFGTTGGTTAHLNNFFDTTYAQVSSRFGKESAKLLADAAKNAIANIRQNITDFKIECGFEEADAYLFAHDDKQEKQLREIHDAANENGVKMLYAKEIPVSIPFVKAVQIPGNAKFHPVKYVYGLAKAFENAGGTIVQNTRVEDIEEGDILNVKTSGGNFKSRYFIYATHIPAGINILDMRCAPYRSYAMALRLKDNAYPKELVYDLDDPYHYYRTQKVGHKEYFIAGGEDHKTGHAENTRECFDKLEKYVRQYFDVAEIAFQWSSQYFEPVDGLPYIGELPGKQSNILCATGYGGNGMIYSNIAAGVLHDIVLQRESDYIKLFNPKRIKPVAGFANFVKENADVAVQMITKFFSTEKVEELTKLGADEGKVVKYENEKMAVYRDDKYEVHAVNPVCKHMKCTVAWNDAEKSWDCPCHGARYSVEGKVLTGPSSQDLEVIKAEV